jgi:hypothetical protein
MFAYFGQLESFSSLLVIFYFLGFPFQSSIFKIILVLPGVNITLDQGL